MTPDIDMKKKVMGKASQFLGSCGSFIYVVLPSLMSSGGV